MDNLKPASEMHILQAASLIRRGELVAFPTETVYGLGANALDDKAIASVYAAKNRPDFNPLIIHFASYKDVESYAKLTEKAGMLIRRFWPGALTLVLKRRQDCTLSKLVSAGLDTIAVRVPEHPIAQSFLRMAACPVAAPSANLSGLLSPTEAHHVADSLEDKVAMILDGGACPAGLESTVVDVSGEDAVLLRPGVVPVEELEAVVGPLRKASAKDAKKPHAPGQLKSHYAPSVPLRMNAKKPKEKETLLGFGDAPEATLNLSPTGDLIEAAANLFAMLHILDADDACKAIAVSPIPTDGIGLAINDRLKRASS